MTRPRPRRAALGRALVATALVVAATSASAGARADAPSPAEALFQEGRALLLKGETQAACQKLEQSLRLDDAVGTLLNLAFCNERLGRMATAWKNFRDVAERSRPTRPDRVKMAEEHVTKLEARLSHLTVEVPETSRGPGLVVTLDGAPLAEQAFGTSMAMDGGNHVVTVATTGTAVRTFVVRVESERDAQKFIVPAPVAESAPPSAAPAPAPPPPAPVVEPPPPAPTPPRDSGGARTAGLVVGIAGVGVLATGAAFGIAAFVAKKPDSPCAPSACQQADAAFTRVNTYAWVANVAIPVGAVLSVVGGYLFFSAPPRSARSALSHVSLGARGLTLDGAF